MARILIVEDEAHILRILSLWLTRQGYEVLEADDGNKALEIIEREAVDAVISDMNLPGVDGLTLVRKIREEFGLSIPLLLLTARCDQVQLAERLRPYQVKLCPKPFVPSQLVADIDALLEASTAEERA